MRSARILTLLAVGLHATGAYAGGFERTEPSPAGVGMAGAQVAVADDAAAVYYNPAGMATQRGFGLLGGAQVVHTIGSVRPPGSAADVGFGGTFATPTVYLTQRLGPHFAVGVGVFSNFAQHLEYPTDWQGRNLGTFFDLTTTTINPSIALRPIPQISIGFGLAVVPSSMGLRQGVTDGLAHSSTTAVGFGGNVGVLIYLVPRYLHFGATYRSTMDLDFAGTGRVDQTGVAQQQQNVAIGVALPHNFSFGLSSRPIPALTLAADAHLTLWRDLSTFTSEFRLPDAPAGDLPTKLVLDLGLQDAVGVRVGAEYRLLAERVRVRLGGGFDTTPVKAASLGPLIPDSYRVTIGAGLGYRHGALGVEAAYSANIILDLAATTRELPATYGSVAHVIALAITVRMEELGTRVNVPEYKH